MVENAERWLSSPRPVEAPKARLFCIPYAGGAASIYKPWVDHLPASLEIRTVQLPGRSGRLNEQPVDELNDLVDELSEILEPWTDVPFALYGHSMGALVAYELTKRLWEEFHISPTHLFVAARRAPHNVSRDQTLHVQPATRIRDFLKGLRVVPAEVLDNEELMELLLPALRADLKLDTMYEYVPGSGVACPVVAFAGKDDEYVSREEVAGWAMHAGGGFDLVFLEGDHFFMDHPVHRRALLQRMTREMDRFL